MLYQNSKSGHSHARRQDAGITLAMEDPSAAEQRFPTAADHLRSKETQSTTDGLVLNEVRRTLSALLILTADHPLARGRITLGKRSLCIQPYLRTRHQKAVVAPNTPFHSNCYGCYRADAR
jgi:hypothetical protein